MLDGVVPATIDFLRRSGVEPVDLWAAVGPSICGSCYEVPEEMLAVSAQREPACAPRTPWGTPGPAVPGGRVPREYIPSVDAGIQEAMQTGVLAGYPMVGIKATLEDGAYHEVDSSEMAFKIAGNMVLREGARRANPVLLEPVMDVEVRTPEEYMGDVIGDLNSRRGMIKSMEDATGVKIVRALVPLSEMFGYVGDLRSKTQGRAVYTMQFDSYAEVPKNVSEEIIKKTRGE